MDVGRIREVAQAVSFEDRGHGFLRVNPQTCDEDFQHFEQYLGESVTRVSPQSPQELVNFARQYAAQRGRNGQEVIWLDSREQRPEQEATWNQAWVSAYNALNGFDHQSLPSRFLLLAIPPGVLGPALNSAAPDFFSKRTF
jgi:hypothetical protein